MCTLLCSSNPNGGKFSCKKNPTPKISSKSPKTMCEKYLLWHSSFSYITQIWHFWIFFTKLTQRGFKISKNKIASTGNRTHNTNHLWIRVLTALPTQPPRHSLNRKSLNWTWIISGSIEHDFIRVWKSETGTDWQIGLVNKAEIINRDHESC